MKTFLGLESELDKADNRRLRKSDALDVVGISPIDKALAKPERLSEFWQEEENRVEKL